MIGIFICLSTPKHTHTQLLHGRQVPRLLPDHHCVLARRLGCLLRVLRHCAVPGESIYVRENEEKRICVPRVCERVRVNERLACVCVEYVYHHVCVCECERNRESFMCVCV
jgi:hypothetical protein